MLLFYMPRKARIDAPGALHHVICRGIEGRKIFWTDSDREDFLERIEKVLVESQTPCYAWALMPNHFHLLLRTGNSSIACVMSRILSGYAGWFNRRHRRIGHLFQNRYKSILCQEESYFLELVRYIHLNPLRADLVATLDELDRYQYGGHSSLMGYRENVWQSSEMVLSRFGKKVQAARRAYRSFVEKGILLGKRPELTGGGLIRSMGGWTAVKSLRRSRDHFKGDERILGDSDFVEAVLAEQNEHLERRYAIKAQGCDLKEVVRRAGEIVGLEPESIMMASKQPRRVEARILVCYWAIRELGMTAVSVARLLGITQSAVTKAVYRGEKFAKDRNLRLAMQLSSVRLRSK
jgi:REP element-mobilizing transposase RayT